MIEELRQYSKKIRISGGFKREDLINFFVGFFVLLVIFVLSIYLFPYD